MNFNWDSRIVRGKNASNKMTAAKTRISQIMVFASIRFFLAQILLWFSSKNSIG